MNHHSMKNSTLNKKKSKYSPKENLPPSSGSVETGFTDEREFSELLRVRFYGQIKKVRGRGMWLTFILNTYV